MKKKLVLTAAVIAALSVVSCNGKKTNSQGSDQDSLSYAENDSLNSNDVILDSIAGTYEGTLPAADCPGIKTVLTLNADSTYQYSADYLERKDGPSWVGDGGGELDIMEWVGNEPEKLHFSCHSKNVTAGTGNFYTDPADGQKYSYSKGTEITNPSDDYHCFGMEWTHEYIKGYLDGVEYYYAPNPIPSATDVAWWPFDQEYYIKLNLAIGGSWGGTVDPAFTSATFAVDWVRVYQK